MMSNVYPCHKQRLLTTILFIIGVLLLDLIWWKDNPFFSIKAYSSPSHGQVVVDPNNPAWFKYYKGGPFFMCGPGDPEGFLYRGTMNPDGTRKGDQLALIDKLKGTGANSIYLMAVRSHGGDGDATQNPFINNDPAQGINQKVLDQWESWFREMDKNKITIFFIFYDDGTGIWGLDDSGKLQTEEKNFIQTLVDRFKHHKHLIWVVAEEYEEMDLDKSFANPDSRLHTSKIAEAIRMADTKGHPISVHQQGGLTYAFPDDPNVDQFALQYGAGRPEKFHNAMVGAWEDAGGRYNLNLAEYHPIATGATARKNSWAIAMGGAYVMHLGWNIENNTLNDLRDCGRLVSFMESTNFNEMSPHGELKHADTEYVLAVPGSSYIAYTSSSSGKVGLRNMTAGVYDFRWFSPENGTTVKETDISVAAGKNSWTKPPSIGSEVAVYIERTGSIPLPLPESQTYPDKTWQRVKPAKAGLSQGKLKEFQTATGDKTGIIIKDGYLAYSWGSDTDKIEWGSAVKPVISTMLLFALAEGKISSVDDPIALWGWAVREEDRSMTFRHLANMVSGYALPEGPGAAWGYNDYAISLYVKTLFDRVFQQPPNEAVNDADRLQPLEFQDGNIFGSSKWKGLYTTPRDFARIGWLWLNKGHWKGRQLLPPHYFDRYFVPQVPSDMPRTAGGTDDYLDVGTYGGDTNQTSRGPGVYGFNFWHNRDKLLWPDIPEDVYQANGHWNGEVLTVLPSQNMVAVWQGNPASSENFPEEMNRLLKILLEATIPEA